jgi:hypothetical protein
MANNNSTENMMSSNGSLTPNIILDSFGISFCIIALCKTFIFILLILIRRGLTKSKDKVLFLLSLNMYMSIFISTLGFLNMFTTMLIGHLHPDISVANFDTPSCHLIIYLTTIAIICTLYSNTFQALHRFVRIIYYTRPVFHRNIYLYIFGILIQILLSTLQPLPIVLTGGFQYEDYHCQVRLINWHGILMGALLVWLPPVTVTVIIYVCTIRYVRRNVRSFTLQQKTRIKRDVTVIKRILWLVVFILAFGTPACTTTIVYYVFGYVGWWANHLTWLTFVFTFIGISVVQTCYSPHLRVLWSRTPH